jgi:nitroreductase
MQFLNDRRQFLKRGSLCGAGFALGISDKALVRMASEESDKLTVLEVIHQRRSVRKYKPTPVPDEHLRQILDAARMAPTSGNQQPWKFMVIRDRAKLDMLKTECISRSLAWYRAQAERTEKEIAERKDRAEAYYTDVVSAPVFIVVLTDNESKYPTYNRYDGPLAAGTLMLAARALGYGTVFYTDSIPADVTKQVLRIPDRYERVCITPLGVPVEWPERPEKKDLESFIVEESFE